MYFNVHTHHKIGQKENVVSIYNFNVGEFICCCGLDLRSTNYSLGIHPWKINIDKLPTNIDFIEKNAIFDCVKAIGECGLDKLCGIPWEDQLRTFVAQINISENLKKPLIIHCVKSFDELISLKKQIKPSQVWIIHGFKGKPEQAEQLIKQDFYLSFGPKYNVKTIRIMPFDHLFLETDDSDDSIESVYEKVSACLNIESQELAGKIAQNVYPVFDIKD